MGMGMVVKPRNGAPKAGPGFTTIPIPENIMSPVVYDMVCGSFSFCDDVAMLIVQG
jgi:hypothetical protein